MQEAITTFKQHLKDQDHFATKPRIQLFRSLVRNGAQTTAELIESLPSQDKSSIYRNIELFESLRVIKKVQLGWRSNYELTELFDDHHHHLTCLACEKVIKLEEDLVVEQEIFRQSYRHKFKALEHTLEIRGLCVDCT